MAWTALASAVTGDIITASFWNTYGRDNLQYLYDNKITIPASSAQGDVLYRDGSAWTRLAAGTSRQVLKTLGASANPAWAFTYDFPDRLRRYQWLNFNTGSSSAWDGSGTADNVGNLVRAKTMTTASSYVRYRIANYETVNGITNFYDANPAMSFLGARDAAGGASAVQNKARFGMGSAIDSATDTGKGFGFRVEGDTIYAWNADGSTQTTTDVSSGITITNLNHYHAVMTSGTNIEFYINNSLVATHTTNLPSGGEDGQFLWSFRIDNGTNTANHAWLVHTPIISF